MKAIVQVAYLALLGILVTAGCENNHSVLTSDGDGPAAFRIDPDRVALGTNLTHVVFEVMGGKPPFRWTLSDPTLGLLTGTNSHSRFANYASFPAATNRAVNTLRVIDDRQWSSTALIYHGP